MKNLLLSLMFLAPAVCFAQDREGAKPEKVKSLEKEIQRLIKDLGDDNYQVREKSQRALEKIGKPALGALQKALKSSDLEVSSRAQELIGDITGKKIKPKPRAKRDVPSRPGSGGPLELDLGEPELPFNPDALNKLDTQKLLEAFQKVLDGTKNGTPDLESMKELIKDFLDAPEPPKELTPKPAPKSDQSDIEKDLGLKTIPVDDTLRAHLIISPRSGSKPAESLERGLVIKKINSKGRAYAWGFRKNDILLFVADQPPPKMPLPGPWVAWDKWRNRSIVLDNVKGLEALKTKKAYVEIIRQGKSCHIIKVSADRDF